MKKAFILAILALVTIILGVSCVQDDEGVLSDILLTPPTKTTYNEGDTLSLEGLVVKARFTNNTEKLVTDYTATIGDTGEPVEGHQLVPSDKRVTITYSENGREESNGFDITVNSYTLLCRDTWFDEFVSVKKEDITSEDITSIEFLLTEKAAAKYPTELTNGINLDEAKAGTVKGYLLEGGKIVIVGNRILANADSSNMFGGSTKNGTYQKFSNLTTLDLSGLDTKNVTNMTSMFGDCNSLTTLDVSTFDTSQVTSMGSMFFACSKLTSLDLTAFDTSKVEDMYNMFMNCGELKSLTFSSSIDTSNVTTMFQMFYACYKLSSLDLSSFDTTNVIDMNRMFYCCESLTTLDVSSFDTSAVKNMSDMFFFCTGLTSIDISGFDTSNVTNMNSMFGQGFKLESITFGENFHTTSVTDMSGMFYGCYTLTTLDLTPFSLAGNPNTKDMFTSTNSLTKVYVEDTAEWSTVALPNGTYEVKSST